jgi:hypothetical protein
MTSKFAQMAAQARETKNLDKLIPSDNKYLGDGYHDVTITAVDSSKIESNARVDFTFEDATGKSHTEKVFLQDYNDKAAFSLTVRRLWAGLLGSRDAVDSFLQELESNGEAFNMFTGMKVGITLKPGPGYVIKVTDDKKFGAYDSKDGTLQTKLHDSIEDLKLEAGALGLRRSFRRLNEAKATHADGNRKQLDAAIKARAAAKAGVSDFSVANAGGSKVSGGIV